MCDGTEIVRDIQRVVREKLDLRKISLKVISAKSDIPYSTLCTYFPGNERGAEPRQPTQIPHGAVYNLYGVIPDDLLNLLCPEGFAIVRVPKGINHDDICEWAETFTAKKLAAHRKDSEHQEAIGPNERQELNDIVVAFPGRVA